MELKNVEIIRINDLKRFENSDFYCVEWHVKTEGQYPQILNLQSNKEKADNLIKYNKVGDNVDVSINLRGREWTNPQGEIKVFNTIEAWNIFKAEEDKMSLEEGAAIIDAAFPPADNVKDESADDLPF
jgi:hypothetical protein